MFKDINSLREAIKSNELDHFEEQIVSLAKPTIRIMRQKVEEDSISIGESKLGGNPDLSPDFQWRYFKGKPLTFIGQFKLSELAPYDKSNSLPETGILYYFYDADEIPWGEPEHRGGWQVFYVENENSPLARRQHPKQEGEYITIDMLPAHKIHYELAFSIPQIYINEFEDYGLKPNTKNMRDAYWELSHQRSDNNHYFLGYPAQIQGDIKWEVVVGSQGIKPKLDPETKRYSQSKEQSEYILSEREKWEFLFQLDSDNDLNVMWGDLGTLYICIPKQKLIERRFEDCWTIMQCY